MLNVAAHPAQRMELAPAAMEISKVQRAGLAETWEAGILAGEFLTRQRAGKDAGAPRFMGRGSSSW